MALSWAGMAPASAQKGFNAGINGGYFASGMLDKVKFGEVPYNLKWKSGPSLGLAMGYNFTDYFGIAVEGNYIDLGGNFDYMQNNVKTNRSFDLTYYQIPVMFKFSGGNFPDRFSSMIGPAFGFLSRARTDGNMVENNGASFKNSDLGILLSAGADLMLVQHVYVNISARFYWGLGTVNNDPQLIRGVSGDNDKLMNAYVGLSLGIHNLFVSSSE